jgi:hypothetical protein
VREGSTEKAVGASTAPKKKIEPIHKESASKRMKRRVVKIGPPELLQT